MIKYDLHVHSVHSSDAHGSIQELAEAAQRVGLTGFAVTDHDTVAGHADIQSAREATGLHIVPGIEVTTAAGHVLAIGVTRSVPKGMGLRETAQAIHSLGGIAIPSHPLKMLTGIGPSQLKQASEDQSIQAVEATNARQRPLVQDNTLRLVRGHGLAATGGSDAHWVHDIGAAYTVLEARPQSTGELVSMLRDGLCRPGGGTTARHKILGHQLSLAVPPLRRKVLQKQGKLPKHD